MPPLLGRGAIPRGDGRRLIRGNIHSLGHHAVGTEHVTVELPTAVGSLPDPKVLAGFNVLPHSNVSNPVDTLLDANVAPHHAPGRLVAKTDVLVDVGLKEGGNGRFPFDERMTRWKDLGVVRVVSRRAQGIALVEVARHGAGNRWWQVFFDFTAAGKAGAGNGYQHRGGRDGTCGHVCVLQCYDIILNPPRAVPKSLRTVADSIVMQS